MKQNFRNFRNLEAEYIVQRIHMLGSIKEYCIEERGMLKNTGDSVFPIIG